jgi:ribosomal protein L37AE/L43A
MSTATYNIGELLEQAGARPRGNRHDCPACGGVRTIAHADDVFYCHKCQWKGNTITLAKELGVFRRLSPEEYRQLQQNREHADRAARALYERVRERRFELLDSLRDLNMLAAVARKAGPSEAAWDSLALVYSERPALLAELTAFENCRAADLLRFLTANDATRERAITRVVRRGGLYDHAEKFVEVCP